jgi:hypothetical protein
MVLCRDMRRMLFGMWLDRESRQSSREGGIGQQSVYVCVCVGLEKDGNECMTGRAYFVLS